MFIIINHKEREGDPIRKGGQTAVDQAIAMLKECCEKAGVATTLVQHEPPAPFDSQHKGMQSGNGGVIGFLEVIESDSARL